MKIARVDSVLVKVPFSYGAAPGGPPARTGPTNNILLVKVETDTGITGWGEAFCYGRPRAAGAGLHAIIPAAAGGRPASGFAPLSRGPPQQPAPFGPRCLPSLPHVELG